MNTQQRTIDLNCDLGESYGAYHLGRDEEMIPLVTSVNVACGFHAGDPAVMNRTVALAKQYNVGIGAHPSFPDLQGFGRRQMEIESDELYSLLVYQIGALQGFTQLHGVSIQHVKPHGALSNMAGRDIELARVIAAAVKAMDDSMILLAPVGSQLAAAGQEAGLSVAHEVFADRAYEPDGSLRSRKYADALLANQEQVLEHVLQIVQNGEIQAVDGTRIAVKPHSICLHGDGSNAVELAQSIQVALKARSIQLRSLKEVVGGDAL